jgi:hypothetical protein
MGMRNPRASSPQLCTQCREQPGLVVVEANGVTGGRAVLCGWCVASNVAEQRARRVTPIGGVPLAPSARSRPLAPRR